MHNPLNIRPFAGILLCMAMALCMGPLETLGAQDKKGPLERASKTAQELIGFRLQAAVQAAGERKKWSPEKVAELSEKGTQAVEGFLEKHPVKQRPRGRISFGEEPFLYEDFGTFLAGDSLAAALGPEEVQALVFEYESRQETVAVALTDLIQALVERGLCLDEATSQGLHAVYRKAAENQLDEGWAAPYRFFSIEGEEQKTFPLLLQKAGLTKALTGKRQEIFKQIANDGRSVLHDYFLETEFVLLAMEDSAGPRRLLRGCGDSLAHRGGAAPKVGAEKLGPYKDLKKDKFWNLMLKNVLGLTEAQALPEFPSRMEKPMRELRTQYLLAILDSQAFLSEQQLADLLPLITKYIGREGSSWNRGLLKGLLLPTALAMNPDGMLDVSVKEARGSGARTKALRTGLAEACSPQQKELLDV
ncbi:MAG: hypothetical protein GY930_11295 [bacterium]|nr:hypothetical protein [bacterium]